MADNRLSLTDTPLLPLISICIPTYQRPDLLAEALESCFLQTYPQFEIVIGDDSQDIDTEQLIARYSRAHPGRIRYARHVPSLGQNRNVNDLFARAQGSRLLLLHDDDRLLPNALANLARLWEDLPTLDAAFGKQVLIEHDGRPTVEERTKALNDGYHRVAANAGRQLIPVVAGLQRMFPNDGFLVTTELARTIGYRSMEEIGHACDTDFGLRLCAAARDIWFLDEFTMQYRLTGESISKYAIGAPYTYDMLAALRVSPAAEPMLEEARREIAPSAVSGFTQLGQPKRAWQVFQSSDYPLRKRFSARGIYHLLLIARSLFARRRISTSVRSNTHSG
jgi:glycosyltransferase involved in cell wall biosynthesis